MKNKPSRSLLVVSLGLLSVHNIYAQPYYNTHVKNAFVKENSFIGAAADTAGGPQFATIKDKLPQPIWAARPDVLKCYWRTWELAFGNIKQVSKENGFVAPYIDPAFNGCIFMWDCNFMTMFGKYASRAFNFQNTLNNFYAKQHADGFICREIRETNGTDQFERFDPSSTGPNVLPWSEWEYYLT